MSRPSFTLISDTYILTSFEMLLYRRLGQHRRRSQDGHKKVASLTSQCGLQSTIAATLWVL